MSQQVPKYLSQQWEKASEKGEVGKISIEKYVVKKVNVTDFIHGFMYLNLSFMNVLMFSAPSDRKQGRPEVRPLLLIYHLDWPTFKNVLILFSFNYIVFIHFAHKHNENVSLGLWVSGVKFLTGSIMKISFFGKPVQNIKISSTQNNFTRKIQLLHQQINNNKQY